MTFKSHTLRSGVSVHLASREALVHHIIDAFAKGGSIHVCTVNPEISEYAHSHPEYLKTVQLADIRTIDGIGIKLAVLRQLGQMHERVTGVQLVDSLIVWARSTKTPVLIIGANEESRLAAEFRLQQSGVAILPGYSPLVTMPQCDECDSFAKSLPGPALVLLALGHPKQEHVTRRLLRLAPTNNVYVGCGGVIDYISGRAPSPPRLISSLGMEWLFRLATSPRMRWKRQSSALPHFLVRELLAFRK